MRSLKMSGTQLDQILPIQQKSHFKKPSLIAMKEIDK